MIDDPGSRARGRVSALLAEARELIPGEAVTLDGIQRSLDDPLRIAVVGRLNAGKSTLVNALLGHDVASTAPTEATRLVTWYRHSVGQMHASLILDDARTVALDLEAGRPPTSPPPGIDPETIVRMEIGLPSTALDDRIIIDTPGLATTTSELDQATRDAILGREPSDTAGPVAPTADVALFVFRDVDRADEHEFIRQFVAATSSGSSAINALGVLSHADTHGRGAFGQEDPIESATVTAGRIATDLRGELDQVVPVSGLLAETARCGLLREQDRRAIEQLAALPSARLQLLEADDASHLGIEADEVRRLQRLLGRYGLQVACQFATAGLSGITEAMTARSGFAALDEMLDARIQPRTAGLKVSRAIATLERLSLRPQLGNAGERVLDAIERAEHDPDLHMLAEVRAVDHLSRAGLRDHEIHDQLVGFLVGASVTELLGVDPAVSPTSAREVVMKRAANATGWANLAHHPSVQAAARVLARSYLLLAERLPRPNDGNNP